MAGEIFEKAFSPEGAKYLRIAEWERRYPVRTFFSTRDGGVSSGAFSSLNMGFSTGDERECVEENRRRVLDSVGETGYREVAPHQVHRARISCVRERAERADGQEPSGHRGGEASLAGTSDSQTLNYQTCDYQASGCQAQTSDYQTSGCHQEIFWLEPGEKRDGGEKVDGGSEGADSVSVKRREKLPFPDTDALITDARNVVLTSLHADCIPVWLYDPVRHAAGLAHAGWRGTAADIAAKTVRRMCDIFGSRAEDIEAAVGPGIGTCCFEVGGEVIQAFESLMDAAGEFYTDDGNGKYHLDLKGVNEALLRRAGVSRISVTGYDTCCGSDLFYSYRRDGGVTGRMCAGIVLL